MTPRNSPRGGVRDVLDDLSPGRAWVAAAPGALDITGISGIGAPASSFLSPPPPLGFGSVLPDRSKPSVAALPQHRAVMPLPTGLSHSATPTPATATRTIVAADGSIMVVADPPPRTVDNDTFASRARARDASSAQGTATHLSRMAQGRAVPKRVGSSSCCNRRREHPAVPGLYVTFCEDSLEARIDAAAQDLNAEREAREADDRRRKVEALKAARDLAAAESERDELRAALAASEARRAQEVADIRIVRDEFEARYERGVAEVEAARATVAQAAEERRALGVRCDNFEFEATRLAAELHRTQEALAAAQRERDEAGVRADAFYAERAAAVQRRDVAEEELRVGQARLAAQEQLNATMQGELQEANDRLSGIAALKDSLRSRAGALGDASRSLRNATAPTSPGQRPQSASSTRLHARLFRR